MKRKTTLFLFFLGILLNQKLTAQENFIGCGHQKVVSRSLNQRLNFSQELYDLMNMYDVKQYHLNLNVETNTTLVEGNVKFYAKALADISTFAFELHRNYTVSSVVINGQSYTTSSITRNDNEARVNLGANIINADNFFEATIYYSGNGPVDASNSDAGFCQQTASNGKKYTYTMSQPYGSADWMPVKQILADKADSLKVYITTSNTNKVGSQGLLKNVVDVGGGKSRYEWESKYPIAYYLISFAVGEYVEYNTLANVGGGNVPIISYLYDAASVSTNTNSLNQCKLTLEQFSDDFGAYPFKNEKYGHCQVPHNFWLENQTMSSMPSFPNGTVAHELAHQWFGDAMSLQSFSEIGLSEGFASYSEYLYREHFVSQSAAQSFYQNWVSSITSQPGGSVYVTDSLNTTRMFDGRLTYQKGGALIHLIRYLVNDDALFFEALRTYTAQFQHKVVTYADFAGVIENVTGINLTPDFLPQWFRGEGYPTYAVTWNWKDGYLHILSIQSTSQSSVTPFFKMPFELELTDANGVKQIIRLAQNQNLQTHKIAMPTAINSVSFDPRVFLLAKYSLNKDNNLIIEENPPQITSFNPAHEAEQVAINSNLEVTFDETIQKNIGLIVIKNEDGSDFYSFNVATAGGISVSNNKLKINPPINFSENSTYYVEIGNEAISDKLGNVFEGFSGNNVWRFSTYTPPLALEESKEKWSIYPNPFKDKIYIQGKTAHKGMLFNSLGQKVVDFSSYSPTHNIDTRFLPAGVYYLQLQNEQATETLKVIKY
ncbi:MAG: M1 family aminopeptidase [Thermonemataceae bacterium]|nr:M1 family aminopeptidase [Thermonemataceae bacterium]